MARRPIDPLLADLSTAQRALKQSADAFDAAVAAVGDTVAATGDTIAALRLVHRAHRDVLVAVIAATQKAMALGQGRTR